MYDAYYNSASYKEIVERIGQIPEEVVGATIDEMMKQGADEDVQELKGIARKAGYTSV